MRHRARIGGAFKNKLKSDENKFCEAFTQILFVVSFDRFSVLKMVAFFQVFWRQHNGS